MMMSDGVAIAIATAMLAAAATLLLPQLLRRRSRRYRAGMAPTGNNRMLDDRGFLVVRSSADRASVARMSAAIEAVSNEAEAGGYRIWMPASALPQACREWAEADAAAILQRSLPPGTPAVRLLGGAALWKRPGMEALGHGGHAVAPRLCRQRRARLDVTPSNATRSGLAGTQIHRPSLRLHALRTVVRLRAHAAPNTAARRSSKRL